MENNDVFLLGEAAYFVLRSIHKQYLCLRFSLLFDLCVVLLVVFGIKHSFAVWLFINNEYLQVKTYK